MERSEEKLLAQNKKARHEYFIEKEYEAGIVLQGTEVKSIKQGKVSIQEAYCDIRRGEVWIVGMHVTPYEQGNIYNTDPTRKRKLLLNRREIRNLERGIQEKGYTLIPLKVYERDGLVKLQIGLAKGKKLYDKRQSIAEKDAKRRLDKAMKNYY